MYIEFNEKSTDAILSSINKIDGYSAKIDSVGKFTINSITLFKGDTLFFDEDQIAIKKPLVYGGLKTTIPKN